MMKPKDWVKGGIVEVGHVSIIASESVNDIVKRFQTVGVGRGTGDPSFVSKLGEVTVRGEEVVQAISCRNLIVVNLRSDKIVLANS